MSFHELAVSSRIRNARSIPPEEILDTFVQVTEELNTFIKTTAPGTDVTCAFRVPERRFLVEIGTVQVLIDVTLPAVSGIGGLFILKTLFEHYMKLRTFKKTEEIRQATDLIITKEKASIDLETERLKSRLRAEQKKVSAAHIQEVLLNDVATTGNACVRDTVVALLRSKGYGAR